MAKNTKQSNQKKSVLNKLGGLSKRSKFIVVVLIFAVLGGGYLTYKSFAATAYVSPIQTNADNMIVQSDGCPSNITSDPAKNNANVMNVYCNKGQRFWIRNKNYITAVPNTMAKIWPQGSYRTCAMVKGVGYFTVAADIGNDGVQYYVNDSSYKKYCSQAVTIGAAGRRIVTVFDTGEISSGYKSGRPLEALISIASLNREWSAPGAAAPSGGK